MGKWQTSWINDSGRKEEEWSEARGQVCSLRHFVCIEKPRPEQKMLSAQSQSSPLMSRQRNFLPSANEVAVR